MHVISSEDAEIRVAEIRHARAVKARFASDAVQSLLAAAGVVDFKSALRLGEPLYQRTAPGRADHAQRLVRQATLDAPEGPLPVYIKLQLGRIRWYPRFREMFDGTSWLTLPEREWRGLHWLRALGLSAAQPLALFAERLPSRRSAVLLRAVPPPLSLHDMLAKGSLAELPANELAALGSAIAGVHQRIVSAGYFWKSIEPKHLYPERTGRESWRLWLIDCESVQRRQAAQRSYSRLLAILHRYRFPQQLIEAFASHSAPCLRKSA
jgi:Lipopolysaccharide kinase (Kdo/WaaP) family